MSSVENEDLIEALCIVKKWHSRNIKTLNEMIESDDGSLYIANGDNGEQVELTGEILRGFKIGLSTAELILGKLPFSLDQNEGPDDAEL